MANGPGKGNGRKKKGANKGGRKTRCTKALTEQFTAIIRTGATSKDACNALAVNEATAAEWMTKGEQGKAPCYVAFREAVIKARGLRVVKKVKIVSDSADAGNTADAKWLLAVWNRKVYGQKYAMEHSGDAENPLEVKHSGDLAVSIDSTVITDALAACIEAGIVAPPGDGPGGDAPSDEVE